METQAFTVRLPVDLYQRLRQEAYEAHARQSEIVIRAVAQYLAYEDRETASGTEET